MDTFDTFSRKDLPLLITFPNSGTNWIRYIVEYFSGKPTPGENRLIGGNNYVIDRSHDAKKVINNYNSCILSIRNFKEIFAKLIIKRNINEIDDDFLNTIFRKDKNFYFFDYFSNINSFDNFNDNKLLLYHEDILFNTDEIKKLLDFLNIFDKNKFNDFVKNLEKHKEKSFKKRVKDGKGSKDDLYFHSKKLDKEKVLKIEEIVKKTYPEIYNKYLKRYDYDL